MRVSTLALQLHGTGYMAQAAAAWHVGPAPSQACPCTWHTADGRLPTHPCCGLCPPPQIIGAVNMVSTFVSILSGGRGWVFVGVGSWRAHLCPSSRLAGGGGRTMAMAAVVRAGQLATSAR